MVAVGCECVCGRVFPPAARSSLYGTVVSPRFRVARWSFRSEVTVWPSGLTVPWWSQRGHISSLRSTAIQRSLCGPVTFIAVPKWSGGHGGPEVDRCSQCGHISLLRPGGHCLTRWYPLRFRSGPVLQLWSYLLIMVRRSLCGPVASL